MILTYVGGALLSWRTVAWLSIGFILVPIIFIWIYVPESPVFLVSKGRIEDAAKSLKFLYQAYPQPENSIESLADMHLRVLVRDNEKRLTEQMNASGKKQSRWAGFKKPTGYKPLTILFFLFLIQQFSGIYITLFFSVTFLQVNECRLFHSSFSNLFPSIAGHWNRRCGSFCSFDSFGSCSLCDVLLQRVPSQKI